MKNTLNPLPPSPTTAEIREKYKNYKVPAAEKNLVHVVVIVKTHLPQLKTYETTAFVQKFPVRTFKASEKAGVFKQYDGVLILHHPELSAQQSGAARLKPTTDAERAKAAEEYRELLGVAPDEDATLDELKAALAETRRHAGNTFERRVNKLLND